MEEQQNSIDEIFRQSLGDYREAPPAAAWGEIARRLDADEGSRKGGFFMRWPWLAMLLLLIGGAAWFTIAMHNSAGKRLAHIGAGGGESSHGKQLSQHSTDQSIPDVKPDAIAGNSAENIASENNSTSSSTTDLPTSAQPLNTSGDQNTPVAAATHTTTTNTTGTIASQNTSTTHQNPNTANRHTTTSGRIKAAQSGSLLPVTGTKRIVNAHSQRSSSSFAHQPSTADNIPASQPPNTPQLASAEGSPNGTTTGSAPRNSKAIGPGSMNNTRQYAASTNKPLTPVPSMKNRSLTIQASAMSAAPISTALPEASGFVPDMQQSAVSPEQVKNATNRNVTPGTGSSNARTSTGFKPPVIVTVPGRAIRTPLLAAVLQMTPESAFSNKADNKALADNKEPAKAQPSPSEQPPADKKDSTKPELMRKRNASFSLALLGGYEIGMEKPAPNRVAVAARLQYHINKVFGIGIQPAFRFGTIASTTLTDPKAYQRITKHDTTFMSFTTSPSIIPYTDTLYNYIIQEAFDSIVVSGTKVQGKFWELELPIILSYKLTNALRIYGGPSFNFGGKLPSASSPDTKTYTTIRRDTLIQSEPIPPSMSNNYFGTNSSLAAYTTYKPALVQDAASMRMGYLLGLSYEQKRLFFDVSVHQQLSGYSNVTPGLQKAFSSPYVRLSLGFYLIPQKDNTKKPID